ncbi:hypothetical protein KM043_016643 [Ampulex compressa]|nr:hypothetical protein KM043_016643 [Ampulex compressa]
MNAPVNFCIALRGNHVHLSKIQGYEIASPKSHPKLTPARVRQLRQPNLIPRAIETISLPIAHNQATLYNRLQAKCQYETSSDPKENRLPPRVRASRAGPEPWNRVDQGEIVSSSGGREQNGAQIRARGACIPDISTMEEPYVLLRAAGGGWCLLDPMWKLVLPADAGMSWPSFGGWLRLRVPRDVPGSWEDIAQGAS